MVDSLDIERQAEEDQKAQERAAEEAAAAQALVDMRLGPAADDIEFQQRISDTQPFFSWGSTKRERRDRLTDYEDALRQGRAMYDPQANLTPGQYGTTGYAPRGGQSAVDPRIAMRRDGMLPSQAQQTMNPFGQAASAYTPGTAAPTSSEPAGPGGPATPRMTEQDIMRAAQEQLLQSQLQGLAGQRDLVSMLSDMREEGFGSQEQFRKDMASQREGFLGEQDAKRAEKFEAEAQQREQRKTTELARQQTQLNQALQASNIDTGAAGDRLASLGIDPGDFADADMSETTAMLYSQNMSAANFINSLDGVAQQAANFAKDANDQASAAALFGIGQDLAFGLQQVDQLRQQGLMDDAMAMQAIADVERQAREANDMAMANFDVETLRAAQAAAARDRAAAKAQRKTEATAASLGILANVREGGYEPTQADLMVLAEAGLGDAFLDIGESESSFLDDLALQEVGSARDLENREFLMRLDSQLNPSGSGGPTPSNTLSYLNFLFENLEDPGALGLDDPAMLGLAQQFGLNLLAPEGS